MKNRKQFKQYRLVASLFVVLIVISSCKKNDDDNFGYNGKWMTERAIPYIWSYARVNYYLTISGNKYTESFFILPYQIYGTYRFVSIEGSLSVSGNQMHFKPERLSYYNCNSKNEKIDPPYDIVSFNNPDDGGHLSWLFYPISSYKAEFTLDRKALNLQIDYDNDGDYSEYTETIIYTRQ